MHRREFAGLIGACVVLRPLGVRAQQSALPVVGFLSSRSPGEAQYVLAAFHQGLKEVGYVEGYNVAIEYRWAEGKYDRLKGLAADLVARKVTLIAATGGTASAMAAKGATSTIPIVFTAGGDLVRAGLVASLNRPGGNVTGASQLATALEAKRLELLRELVPEASTIAVLVNYSNPRAMDIVKEIEDAARVLKRKVHFSSASTDEQIEAAFTALAQRGSKALLVVADPFLDGRRNRLIVLSARYSLPTVHAWREFPLAGGLMSYGTDRKSVV